MEVVGSVADIGKEAWKDGHTKETNQQRHASQCEGESIESCLAWKVGDGQQEICQHKLSRDCTGWGE